MQRTESYQFYLPEPDDMADIGDVNANFTAADGLLQTHAQQLAALEKSKLNKAEMTQHAADKQNPHAVTAAQTGAATQADFTAHAADVQNPHSVTAAQVGLGNVTNESKQTMFESPAFTGTVTLPGSPTQPLHAATKQYVDSQIIGSGSGDMLRSVYDADGDGVVDTAKNATDHAARTDNPHGVTAEQTGAATKGYVDTAVASNRFGGNLLDNSNFVNPVNQRGYASAQLPNPIEMPPMAWIDRWLVGGYGVASIVTTGISLDAQTWMMQKLEHAPSGNVVGSLGILSGAATISYNPATNSVLVHATTACVIAWAKLEIGSVATPYVPKGYGAELAECLRYYQVHRINWQEYASVKCKFIIPLTNYCPMRIVPTMSENTVYFYNAEAHALSPTSNLGYSLTILAANAGNTAATLTAVLSADL